MTGPQVAGSQFAGPQIAGPEVRAGGQPVWRRPSPLDRPAAALLRRLAARIRVGRLEVDGVGGRWSAGAGEPVARITLHDPRAARALLAGGTEGLAESYVAGWWDAEDLSAVVRLLIANLEPVLDRLDSAARLVAPPVNALRRLRPPTVATDRRNVAAHYDLPGELFEVMLDETMTYSCAVFEPPGIDLADAQRVKLDRLAAKLDLGPDDHLLEIGTGWGGLALHMATRTGCRVTTTTLSEAQREVAQRRVAEAGLERRIEVLGLDYRQLEGRFDKLVSVEMIEAVDWRLYPTFFATCERLLAPGGLMALQTITIADRAYDRALLHQDFAKRMIFPGGCLPSVTAICDTLTAVGQLRLVDLEDIGRHYPATLDRWRENLDAGWDRLAAAGFDEGFGRLWRFYLSYCAAAFTERRTSDVQMVLAGRDWRPTAGRGR